MNKKGYFIGAGVVVFGLLLLLVYGLYGASDPHSIPSALINTPAKDFKTVTFDGKPIHLASLKGSPVVLNFWASWCVACRQEAHILEAAHQKYTPKGVHFIGIAINDQREASLGFIARYGKTYTLGPDDATGNISLDYGVTAVPETFLIDREGIIRNKILGAITPQAIEAFLKTQL